MRAFCVGCCSATEKTWTLERSYLNRALKPRHIRLVGIPLCEDCTPSGVVLSCSFCGLPAPRDNTLLLSAGKEVSICKACAALAAEALEPFEVEKKGIEG